MFGTCFEIDTFFKKLGICLSEINRQREREKKRQRERERERKK